MSHATRRRAPHGRIEVQEALLRAAATLFARHGTAAVSVRDVAKRARVNHGLVHRHFGSKESLVRAVMERLAGEVAGAIDDDPLPSDAIPPAFTALASRGEYWKVLARALLDGANPRDLQSSFPAVEKMIASAERAQSAGRLPPEIDPRIATAAAVALGLGWLTFEPFLVAAAGLSDRPRDEVRRELFVLCARALGAERVQSKA